MKISTTMRIENAATSLYSTEKYADQNVSIRPIARPPSIAPGSEPMIGVCAAIAVLGAIGHVATGETFVMPDGRAAIALLALGIGPVGAAFAAWDHATKKGNIALLGALSYATPPLSMILLVVAGEAEPSWRLLVATLLVVAGAALAALPARRR